MAMVLFSFPQNVGRMEKVGLLTYGKQEMETQYQRQGHAPAKRVDPVLFSLSRIV